MMEMTFTVDEAVLRRRLEFLGMEHQNPSLEKMLENSILGKVDHIVIACENEPTRDFASWPLS